MESTQETVDADYMSRVEADKRSILEQLLTFDYDSLSKDGAPSTGVEKEKKDIDKPIDENNVRATLEEEYERIFGDVDVDDSEEIFNNLLKKVETEFKRQMEIKRKNPFLAATLNTVEESTLKSQRRTAQKRKPKAFEQSLKLMDNFKKRLLENPSVEPNKVSDRRNSIITDSSTASALMKSSRNTCVPVHSQSSSDKLKSSLKFYPKWKTSSTYTPIFAAPTNPNWASIPTNIEEKELLTQRIANKYKKMSTSTPSLMPASNELGLPRTMNLSNMYMSAQIRNWVHDHNKDDDNCKKADNEMQLPSSSSKTFRSDQSVYNSELNNDVLLSPMKSPQLETSTPIRETVVRFRPSPPQYFLFNNGDNLSVSTNPSVIDHEISDGGDNDLNTCEYLTEQFVYYENDVSKRTMDHFNAHFSDGPDNYHENCCPVKQKPANNREQQTFINFNERYYSCNSHQSNKSSIRVLNSVLKPPLPSEDFVRNLRYNININYNVINNYRG